MLSSTTAPALKQVTTTFQSTTPLSRVSFANISSQIAASNPMLVIHLCNAEVLFSMDSKPPLQLLRHQQQRRQVAIYLLAVPWVSV
jgi:hypothetical protein